MRLASSRRGEWFPPGGAVSRRVRRPGTLAAVITALYPATTVALAIVFLHERPSRAQQVGLGLAAVAIVLITR